MIGLFFFALFLHEPKALEKGVPQLETIFAEHHAAQFKALLPKKGRVRVDLRPLLNDFGFLSSNQIGICFNKLMDRFEVTSAQIHNSQSDANYGWLDVYLQARLKDRRSERSYNVIFSIQFKITASRWSISQWVIQDVF